MSLLAQDTYEIELRIQKQIQNSSHLLSYPCVCLPTGLQVYNKCWKLEHCNFKDLTTRLRENELTYYCCKKDLCNFNEQLENGGNEQLENGGTSLSEKTVLLLVTPFLAAAWSLHP